MVKSKKVMLKRLDESIERWKKQKDVPWKEWAFGYVLCLHTQNILDYFEIDEVLRQRGIIGG